ncbi:hypothetical protein [Mycolicibacterium canariasense]|uniref:hypothetical protein n=1 Tax=Mycolicibacterium canariasense TaxID=228230 RepID=UPI000A1601FD|nr:hypothetical protein [Mycolicibacterium canariasense]MCV7208421.1 hypothetical protein [Mycolicibacterium canariasense]ORV10800.1 hypothetical protein AWB94_06535 [Mycolicibacterium canariasense]
MVPEVRQDQDPESMTFGAIAVKLPDGSPLGEWGYMTTNAGGGFCRAARVADWVILTGEAE